MKRGKVLAFLGVITIVLQISIFTMLDWQAEQLLNPSFRIDQPYSLKNDLYGAYDYSLSYNNRYLAYIFEDSLNVIDLTNNIIVFSSSNQEPISSILGYKWLPDRNGMVYFAKNNSNSGLDHTTSLFSLNFDTAFDNILASNLDFIFSPKLDRVINQFIHEIIRTEVSTYTNNLYVLYSNKKENKRLITIDMMKNINRIDKATEDILAMSVSNKFGTIFVETNKNSIFAVKGREWNLITDNPAHMLLGCQDDLLFIGKTKGTSLQEVLLYSIGTSDNQGNKDVLWEGNIALNFHKVVISPDHKLLFQGAECLNIICPDGKYISKNISNNTIVLSPTGKMYLEILPKFNKYYWRSI